ncbi:MAG TPA: hypothetical protein VF867_14090 [Arthrobacter sp.]
MSRHRNGNVVLEPPPEYALTAEEAQGRMRQLAQVVSDAKFDSINSVTVHCYRNELMTREYAEELYRLVTVERGVPRLRMIDPTPDAAAYLFDAAVASGNPDSLEVRLSDTQGRTSHTRYGTLSDYLNAAG